MTTSRLPVLSVPFQFLIACLLAAVALGGCDTLEIDDPNAPRADAVSIQNLVSGTEGGMRDELDIYYQTVGIFGREIYFFEPADPRYTGELYTGPLDADGFLVTDPWAGRYRAIRNANELLERAAAVREETPSEFSEADLAAVDGFARTIIGYQLLLVLNSTWDNGLKILFNEDVTTPVVSRERAFEEIETYLNDGFQSLQNTDAFPFALSAGFGNDGFGTPEGFSQFNRAVLARVRAYRGDYSGALEALDDSFIDAGASLDRGVYHQYATGIGERTNPLFEIPTSSTVKLRAHPFLQEDARDGDTRFAEKILDRTADAENPDNDFDASPSAANGLSSSLTVTVYDNSTSPIPIIRNEELLLLRAEARIRGATTDLDAAVDDLDVIRTAAGLGPYAGPVTEEALFDEMLYNRQFSLFLEGHRWVDLRRFGLLDELRARIQQDPAETVGDPGTQTQIFAEVPIPLNELPEN
jgi:hypothetical protein